MLGGTRLVRPCLIALFTCLGLHLVGVVLFLASSFAKADAIHDGILDFVV